MTTIIPQNKLVRDAVKYISEQRDEKQLPLRTLLDRAGMRFNLSPKEVMMLQDFFKQSESDH